MASSVSGSGLQMRGCRRIRRMRERLFPILVSPLTMRAVFQLGFQDHVGIGGRIDAAQAGQNLRGDFHGLYEIACQVCQGGQEQVAEAVSLETAAFRKPVLEQLGEQSLVFRERHHAVTDVARRQNVEFATQASGAAAVIGNRDDGGDFDFPGLQGVALQAMQQRGKPGASTDGDNAKRCHCCINA